MKHCYSLNCTKQDCKLFKINLNEFEDFKDFLRSPGIRSVIDSGSSEYDLMLGDFEECSEIKTDKAWFKLLHLLFGFIGDYDVKNAIAENIKYKLKDYYNYEDTAKMSLARYIILLRTGEFIYMDDRHKELVGNLDTNALVDLLKEELLLRTKIYKYPNSNKRIVEIVDYIYDYDALYKKYGIDNKVKSGEAYDKYIEYITTSQYTVLLKNREAMYSQMYGE